MIYFVLTMLKVDMAIHTDPNTYVDLPRCLSLSRLQLYVPLERSSQSVVVLQA